MTQSFTPITCFGESLWDVLPAGRQPGGAPYLVAVHLHRLGQPVRLVSRVGRDELGTELLAAMDAQGLDRSLVQHSPSHLTGVVKANMQPGHPTTYQVVQPVAWDYIRFSEELRAAVAGAPMLVYGSLAARNAATRETLYRLLQHAAFKVFDVNLRAPHYTRTVVKYLLRQADFVKLNLAELAEIMAWLGQPAIETTALPYLAANFDLQAVCLTKGDAGATLWTDNQFFTNDEGPPATPAAIGRSDVFLAQLLAHWPTGPPAAWWPRLWSAPTFAVP